MKKTYTFISKDPTILLEILDLRRAGLSLDFLAELYNCDRTSLRYQCRKYQIFPMKTVFIRNDKSPEIFNPKRIASRVLIAVAPPKASNWTIVDGERINTGKSYADYLKDVSPYKK
jgi:hypothetical protein